MSDHLDVTARSKPLLGTEQIAAGYSAEPDPLAEVPIPLEAVRDLLGIARALYVVRLELRATSAELIGDEPAAPMAKAATKRVRPGALNLRPQTTKRARGTWPGRA